LRRRVGLLAQHAHVFDATIAENLRVGDPEATDEQLRAALGSVGLDGLLTSLPSGLNTEVGAFGATLSGGERQRISIARVLLAGRAFVILDEPTEHLDAATAAAVSATLADVFASSTSLTITHRLHDLVAGSRIIEMQNGRVTAAGSHAELLSMGGWYSEQWRIETDRQDMAAYVAGLPVGIGVPGPNAVGV
jgi:ABC-type multidrug transport system fused ATPase/permease subunit